MIENNNAAAVVDTTRPRYAPPNQRSRSLSRRKSGDHSNSRSHNNSSSPSFEGERERDNNRQHHHHSTTSMSRSSSTSSSSTNANANDNIITIEGCSRSKAAQLLSNRWSAAIQAYNDPSLHSSEKPVLYTGGGTSAWGSPRLTHQMDFLTELRRAILDAKANPDA